MKTLRELPCDLTNKRVLTFDEACIYTGYKRSYLQKLTAAGIIPHSKPNNKTLFFDRVKLEEWLLSRPRKGIIEQQTEAANYITSHK